MEPQIFMWTGKIIWYAACLSAVLSVITVGIFAPIMAYKSIRWRLWEWKLSGELAKNGFTEAGVRFALSVPGGLPCDYDKFIEAVKRIKERGEAIKKVRP